MTHQQLIDLGVRMLIKGNRYVPKCALVVSEIPGAHETPDVYGISCAGTTVLLECKASRADFLRDAKKWHRQNNNVYTIGQQRYYLVPPGVIKPEEDTRGFGVVEAQHPKHLTKCFAIKQCVPVPEVKKDEIALLLRFFRQAGMWGDHQVGQQILYCRPWSETDPREPKQLELLHENQISSEVKRGDDDAGL